MRAPRTDSWLRTLTVACGDSLWRSCAVRTGNLMFLFCREAGPKNAPDDSPALRTARFISKVRKHLLGSPIAIRLLHPITRASRTATGRTSKTIADRFDLCPEIINQFTVKLGFSRYTLCKQDYGSPVGLRMTLAHSDRIEALIVQGRCGRMKAWGTDWKTQRDF